MRGKGHGWEKLTLSLSSLQNANGCPQLIILYTYIRHETLGTDAFRSHHASQSLISLLHNTANLTVAM